MGSAIEENVFSFKAPCRCCETELTVKRSRFIGSVRVVLSAEQVAEELKKIPVLYPKATHHCWAYRIGTKTPLEHCSDAGEPSGTAGRPILGAIKHFELENTLVIVTRYFGGIKLGVRGLIEAYGETARIACEEAGSVEMEFCAPLELACGYDYSKTLSTTLDKYGFTEKFRTCEYGENVSVKLDVPLSKKAGLKTVLDEMFARRFLSEYRWSETSVTRPKTKF